MSRSVPAAISTEAWVAASEVVAYLDEKAQCPAKEWLRREPRSTHPEILALVREFEASGGGVNDECESFITWRVYGMPVHRYHGHADRHPLTDQLGHEVYIARQVIRDEVRREREVALLAAGFVPLVASEIVQGATYEVALGTVYCGSSVPDYAAPLTLKARNVKPIIVWMLPRARTNAVYVPLPALVRRVSA